MQHNTVRQKQRVHHESNDGGEGELIHSALLGSDGCLCLFRPLGPFVSYIAWVRHGIIMPLTPARSAAYGAWRDELVLVQKALPDRVPRENYLNVPPIDTAFHERYSSTQSYTIYAHVHGRTFAIYCGDGQQTIKWLALTAARRYGEETPQGRLRRRERFNTDNAPHGTAIASTHEHRQHLRLGGTHRKGQFIPLELQKAKRKKARRVATGHVSPPSHALSNMGIMWKASSIASKTKGDLRRSDHDEHAREDGDHHSAFRGSEKLLGHVLHHGKGGANAMIHTLRAKKHLLGKLTLRKTKNAVQEELATLALRSSPGQSAPNGHIAQVNSIHWPELGRVPKPKVLKGVSASLDAGTGAGSTHHHHRQDAIEPNEEKICEVLENKAHIRLHLDCHGGAYLTRENEFAIDAFMRLRFIPPVVKVFTPYKVDEGHVEDGNTAEKFLWVKKHSVSDGNFMEQSSENWKKTKVFRFVKDHDEAEKLQRLFQSPASYNLIRTLFRQYAYSGEGDAFTMSMTEFISCCQGCGIVDGRRVNTSRLSTVFVAADVQLEKKSVKQKEREGNPDNALTLHEFLEALCRVALIKFGGGDDGRSAHDCTKLLLTLHVLPHAAKTVEEWQLLDDIENPNVQLVYKDNIEALKQVFSDGCPIKHNKLEKLYMDLADFEALIDSKGLLSGHHAVSRMTVKEAYVWSQRRATSTHAAVQHEEKSLQRMDFYEFLEALALMAVRMHSDQSKHRGMSLHDKLETLIDYILGRGPSPEEMKVRNAARQQGLDTGSLIDVWWPEKERSYHAVVMGIRKQDLKLVIQYTDDGTVSYWDLEKLQKRVREAWEEKKRRER